MSEAWGDDDGWVVDDLPPCPTNASPERWADYHRAEGELARRARGSLTFRSVRSTLEWFYEFEVKMQGPNGLEIKEEIAIGGRIEGGGGGDIDGAMAAMVTVKNALAKVCGAYKRKQERRDPRRPGRSPAIPPEHYAWMLRAHYVGLDDVVPTGAHGQAHRPGACWEPKHLAAHFGCHERTVHTHLTNAEKTLARVLEDKEVVV